MRQRQWPFEMRLDVGTTAIPHPTSTPTRSQHSHSTVSTVTGWSSYLSAIFAGQSWGLGRMGRRWEKDVKRFKQHPVGFCPVTSVVTRLGCSAAVPQGLLEDLA